MKLFLGSIVIASVGSVAVAQTTTPEKPAASGTAQPPAIDAAEALGKFESLVTDLGRRLPTRTDDFEVERAEDISNRCRTLDAQAATMLYAPMRNAGDWLPRIHSLAAARSDVDRFLRKLLEQRFVLGDAAGSESGRTTIRVFLRMASELISLEGRLNFHLRDGVIFASLAMASQNDLRTQLVEQLDKDGSSIGAAMLAPLLIDPPKDSPNRAVPATAELKRRILLMLGQRGGPEVLPMLSRYLATPELTADLSLLTADSIVRMGLPQAQIPKEEADADRSPEPSVTAAKLLDTLGKIKPESLSGPLRGHRTTLSTWLEGRARSGVTQAGLWNGHCTLQPGDWILMRNSSPYNLFTDLSPGLFTHVGIVTLHTPGDGIQRLVMVDLNERQTVIRPVNVDATIPNSLYYAVLRHEDPAVAKKMSDTAASLIGNSMKFDLNFETARAAGLKGKPLKGTKIETYCAGLLLICAQETGQPAESFFPVREQPALGRTSENMKRIGLQLGADFISPTGPLFARRMKLVHFSEPMFNPGREIEQRIYDHFASGLANSTIEPKGTLFQSLRQQLANASKGNPFLARAIAEAAGVDQETDLASAARAAAVVETLDSIAYGSSIAFADTLRSFRAGPLDDRAKERFTPEEIERLKTLRKTHDGIYQKLERRQISPREVTEALISYYVAEGTHQIDQYFFPSSMAPAPTTGN